MKLFIILELTKEGELFNCDKELNRICGYDESWSSYFLLTSNEVDSIKNQLGDRVVFLENEDEEFITEKYHILSAEDVIGQYWEYSGWDEELERWNDCCGDGDFLDAMDKKYNGGYMDDIRRRAFEKSRILREFADAMNEINEEDYDDWKMAIYTNSSNIK
jgi:hypothetical protein